MKQPSETTILIRRTEELSEDQRNDIREMTAACREHDRTTISYPGEEDCLHYLFYEASRPFPSATASGSGSAPAPTANDAHPAASQYSLSAVLAILPGNDEAECIAFTRPERRKLGLFSSLLKTALKTFEEYDLLFPTDGKCLDTLAALEALDAEPEYQELAMELDLAEIHAVPESADNTVCTAHATPESADHIACTAYAVPESAGDAICLAHTESVKKGCFRPAPAESCEKDGCRSAENTTEDTTLVCGGQTGSGDCTWTLYRTESALAGSRAHTLADAFPDPAAGSAGSSTGSAAAVIPFTPAAKVSSLPREAGTLLGTCETSRVSDSCVCLHHVEILPEYRGLGFGTALMRRLVSALRRQAIRRVILQVSGDNKAALALYKKQGFRITETLTYYLY